MALLSADPARAAEVVGRLRGEEAMGVLVDTTLCVGCRSCETACNQVNGLPKPKVPFEDDDSLLEQHRDTSPTAFTVVNKYTVGQRRGDYKKAAMHALPGAGLLFGVHHKSDGKAVKRCSYISRRPLPGLPLLHGGLPVQRSQVRVFKGVAFHQEVPVLL